jgi:iron(II)-dependent oxidoreductase
MSIDVSGPASSTAATMSPAAPTAQEAEDVRDVQARPRRRDAEWIARELAASRERTLAYTDTDDGELVRQHSPLMSPLVWDLAHIGNYEELWLLRALAGTEELRPGIDDIYDAFRHPRADRPGLALLSPAQARAYLAEVRDRVLTVLASLSPEALAPTAVTPPDRARRSGAPPSGSLPTGSRPSGARPSSARPTAPREHRRGPRMTDIIAGPSPDDRRRLLRGAAVYGLVVQHEHQHDETMLATHQLRTGPELLVAAASPPAARPGSEPGRRVLVPAGPFVMGTSDDDWAYDNERPAHLVDVAAFEIGAVPVTAGEYLAFIADGGYGEERWWSPAGWRWRREADARAPLFWRSDGRSWFRRRFGREEPVALDEPVQHVCWYEAEAYARWAGARLPTEAEWEKACAHDPDAGPGRPSSRRYPWGDAEPDARVANLDGRTLRPAPAGAYPRGASAYGAEQMIGDVWEWTASDFVGYPGFDGFPYREYSEVFFAPSEYKVLRGGSWATHRSAIRSTFRNWDYPIRRQIFAGFRLAWDVDPAPPAPGRARPRPARPGW